MNELKQIVKTNLLVKRTVNFWANKLLSDKQYKGVDMNELSKYYDIKTVTKAVIHLFLLDHPSEKVTSYKNRKIALYIASMIFDESEKIKELRNELCEY